MVGRSAVDTDTTKDVIRKLTVTWNQTQSPRHELPVVVATRCATKTLQVFIMCTCTLS